MLSLLAEAAAQPSVEIGRTDLPLKIDGLLDDEAWKGAAVITDFRQTSPVDGGKPSQETRALLTHDDRAIYIGVWCGDSEPDRILARERRRDGEGRGDDRINIVLDPFGRGTEGFQFTLTAGGARRD